MAVTKKNTESVSCHEIDDLIILFLSPNLDLLRPHDMTENAYQADSPRYLRGAVKRTALAP